MQFRDNRESIQWTSPERANEQDQRMEASVRLGRVWGVPIGLHWSWFLIFVLVTVSLARGYFPDSYPDLSNAGLWIIGAVTSLLFFLSVLLHELGHVRLAQRNGLPVESVTLFLFGGVALLRREAGSAGAEFRIAIAGPAVSLALSAIFGAIWFATEGTSSYLEAPSIYLAGINLALAVFNMIPGYPLDGGRVFKALVWRATGDERRAVRWASVSGQIVAGGFIAIGALRAVYGDIGGGIWLMFIGWFLQNAAAAVWNQDTLQRTFAGVTVARLMQPKSPTVPGWMSIRQLVDSEILGSGRRIFFVDTDGTPATSEGMLTLPQITRIPRDEWETTTVGRAMTPWRDLVCVAPDTPLLEALERMTTANVAQLPVVVDGHIEGVLTREQIVNYIQTRNAVGM
jgi:Zn-dependent protease/CBS domain-containing protein